MIAAPSPSDFEGFALTVPGELLVAYRGGSGKGIALRDAGCRAAPGGRGGTYGAGGRGEAPVPIVMSENSDDKEIGENEPDPE